MAFQFSLTSKGALLTSTFLLPFFISACAPQGPSMAERIDASPHRLLENPTCEVPGNPANWLAAYCMWMNNVGQYDPESDIEDDPVKGCIKDVDRHPSLPRQLCERNKYLKQQMCETLIMNGVFKGTSAQCVASKGTVPRVVREGL